MNSAQPRIRVEVYFEKLCILPDSVLFMHEQNVILYILSVYQVWLCVLPDSVFWLKKYLLCMCILFYCVYLLTDWAFSLTFFSAWIRILPGYIYILLTVYPAWLCICLVVYSSWRRIQPTMHSAWLCILRDHAFCLAVYSALLCVLS